MPEIPVYGIRQTAISGGSRRPLGSFVQYICSYGPTLKVYSATEPKGTKSSTVMAVGGLLCKLIVRNAITMDPDDFFRIKSLWLGS